MPEKALIAIAAALIIHSAVLFGASLGRAQSMSVALEHHRTEMIEVKAGGRGYWFDAMIAPEEARRIFLYRRAAAGVEWSYPRIYAVPGRDDRFIVSDYEAHDGEDFGLRLYLIGKAPSGIAQLSKTSGAGDSYFFMPTFYTGAGRTFILAEARAEYSWGLMAYELVADRLEVLGPLDVAVDNGLNLVDARPYTRATLVQDTLILSFDTDLVINPGGPGEEVLARRSGKPLVFRHEGDGFVLLD